VCCQSFRSPQFPSRSASFCFDDVAIVLGINHHGKAYGKGGRWMVANAEC
jgi:hypothetical protein